MTQRAVLRVDLTAARVVGLQCRRGKLGISLPRKLFADRSPLRQPEGVSLECDEHGVAKRRRLAVHAVAKASLQTCGKGIDTPVLASIRRIHKIRRPQWA